MGGVLASPKDQGQEIRGSGCFIRDALGFDNSVVADWDDKRGSSIEEHEGANAESRANTI